MTAAPLVSPVCRLRASFAAPAWRTEASLEIVVRPTLPMPAERISSSPAMAGEDKAGEDKDSRPKRTGRIDGTRMMKLPCSDSRVGGASRGEHPRLAVLTSE